MNKKNKELDEKLSVIYKFLDNLDAVEPVVVTDDDKENIAILEVVNNE